MIYFRHLARRGAANCFVEFSTEFAKTHWRPGASKFLPTPPRANEKEFTIFAARSNKQREPTNKRSTQWCDLILDAARYLIKPLCK
jgi:hypothetical protein